MSSNQIINKRNGESNKIMVDSVYIPQIDSRLNENDVKMAFRNIADVKYVDFVANKYNNKICSAFVYFYKKFNKQDLEKTLYANEWAQIDLGGVLLENTSQPIPRTKKNIHQVASYLDECFQKMAKQDMQIEKLLQIVTEQSRVAEAHENKISQLEKRIEELELPEMIDPYSYNCDICGQDFLEKKHLYWHSTICKEKEIDPVPEAEESDEEAAEDQVAIEDEAEESDEEPEPEQIQNIEQFENVNCEYCGNCFYTSEITEGRCPACFEDYMNWLEKYGSSPNKNVEMFKYTQQYLDYLDDPFEDWHYPSDEEEEREPPKKYEYKVSCIRCVDNEWCQNCGKYNFK